VVFFTVFSPENSKLYQDAFTKTDAWQVRQGSAGLSKINGLTATAETAFNPKSTVLFEYQSEEAGKAVATSDHRKLCHRRTKSYPRDTKGRSFPERPS